MNSLIQKKEYNSILLPGIPLARRWIATNLAKQISSIFVYCYTLHVVSIILVNTCTPLLHMFLFVLASYPIELTSDKAQSNLIKYQTDFRFETIRCFCKEKIINFDHDE